MKPQLTALTLVLVFTALTATGPLPLSAQERPPSQGNRSSYLAFGLSAGAGAVDNKRLGESWDIGPFFGGRLEWARRESSAWLSVDVQPFQAHRSNRPGEFRAVYILPAYAFGPPGSQVGVALGMGIFDLTPEVEPDNRKVGFVAAMSASRGVSRNLSIELGWKRIRNVAELNANLFTLQLVKRWGLLGTGG